MYKNTKKKVFPFFLQDDKMNSTNKKKARKYEGV